MPHFGVWIKNHGGAKVDNLYNIILAVRVKKKISKMKSMGSQNLKTRWVKKNKMKRV